uniref:Uncharacterized protein n=1 Tax=Arundo donax TaxID=35708 RepID=A0A0A9BU17_ARUDO
MHFCSVLLLCFLYNKHYSIVQRICSY